MSARLEFGKPQDPLQAVIRLPDREHPEYKIAGGPIEHLTHFKEALVEIASGILDGEDTPLNERWIPLELEDMKLLESVSFRRNLEQPILTAQDEYIREESLWAEYLPADTEFYRWWQVTELVPKLDFPGGLIMICVESNDCFDPDREDFRYDEDSTFDIFLVTKEELEDLRKELTRFNR